MHDSLDTLKLQIDYTIWASRRILKAAAALTPDELNRDFGTADRSVLGTLLHIGGADLVWIERMHGKSLTSHPYGDRPTFDTLQTEWPRVWDRWRKYVEGLSEASAEEVVSYLTFKGVPYSTPVWQIVLHVVNHGTHHRGQAGGFIRSMGKTPPTLDLMEFYRSLSP
jgi:uncharacterized damage-inducible protein DinB